MFKREKTIWKKVNQYGCGAGMFYVTEAIYSVNKKEPAQLLNVNF